VCVLQVKIRLYKENKNLRYPASYSIKVFLTFYVRGVEICSLLYELICDGPYFLCIVL
jgi:hypothetical protein